MPVFIRLEHWPAAHVGMPPSTLQKLRQTPMLPPAPDATHCSPRWQSALPEHAAPFAPEPAGTHWPPFALSTMQPSIA